MTKTTSQTLVAALAAASLVAAGCGGSDGAGSGGGGASTTAGDEDRQLAFARCMREEGVEIEMPTDGSARGRTRLKAAPGTAPRKMEEAMETCRKKTGGGGPPELSDEQRTEMRDRALRFAQCMRRNGVDMPDPGEGGALVIKPGAGSPDPRSPAFRRAERACRDLLPRMDGGGTETHTP